MPGPDASERVLVALDVASLEEATRLLDELSGVVTGCKIGSQLFTAAGPAAVEAARKRGFRVFLDLKYHDIPNTVAAAVREATRLGVFMLNVHAAGGTAMMRAAAEAAAKAAEDFGLPRPLVLGVTVLTSLDRRALQAELEVPVPVEAHVLHLAGLARAAGLDGCVASPREVRVLRVQLGPRWVIVTPGIRPAGAGDAPAREAGAGAEDPRRAARAVEDDQARVATPRFALGAGADYLVVGRPITAAPDRRAAAEALLRECAG
jgi:orotidine-5'-phosphate decarboxylase